MVELAENININLETTESDEKEGKSHIEMLSLCIQPFIT